MADATSERRNRVPMADPGSRLNKAERLTKQKVHDDGKLMYVEQTCCFGLS